MCCVWGYMWYAYVMCVCVVLKCVLCVCGVCCVCVCVWCVINVKVTTDENIGEHLYKLEVNKYFLN